MYIPSPRIEGKIYRAVEIYSHRCYYKACALNGGPRRIGGVGNINGTEHRTGALYKHVIGGYCLLVRVKPNDLGHPRSGKHTFSSIKVLKFYQKLAVG